MGRSKEGDERRSSAFSYRRESSLTTCQHAHDEQGPSEPAELVKVILLGAPAVGKTSLVQQFVLNEFCDHYCPTDRRHTYYPSVVINKKLYDLKISDLPPIPYFPVDSLLEWNDFRSYGLRSATAYVLVFDLSNAADTFRHIKCLREQMVSSRDMSNVPVVVVGNKHDRIRGPVRFPEGDHVLDDVVEQPMRSSYGGSCSFLSPPTITILPSLGSSTRSLLAHQHHQHQQQQKAIALSESRERRDIANIVQKHWRCGYVECSAKYNWRVVAVFKELMQAVDAIDGKEVPVENGEDGGPTAAVTGEEAGRETVARYHVQRHHGTSIVVESFPRDLERNKCSLL
ncbi:ras-like protein family member 10B isoform X2 [Ischnura elegans]|nr:ras-like protein family member 10B isoform X2 [Ischnura elegans]